MAILHSDEVIGKDEDEDERRAEEHRQFMAGPDGQRWSRLLRMQGRRFRDEVDSAKPLYDFIRMVLTVAFVFGLAQLVGKGMAEDEHSWVVTGLCTVSIILAFPTLFAASHFSKCVASFIAIQMKLPFNPRAGSGAVFVYLILMVVQVLVFAMMISLATQVADRISDRFAVAGDGQAIEAPLKN